MYSRHTGFSPPSNGYTSEYLKSRYAEKTAPRRSPFKAPQLSENATEVRESRDIQPSRQENSTMGSFLSNLENDDIILLCVLAFLLFGDREDRSFDLILAAALLFVEFG